MYEDVKSYERGYAMVASSRHWDHELLWLGFIFLIFFLPLCAIHAVVLSLDLLMFKK